MRKLLLNLALVFVLCAGVAFGAQTVTVGTSQTDVALLHQDQVSLTMQVDIGEVGFVPISTNAGSFVMMAVDGFARSHDIGQPDLPVVNRIISIPFGCTMRAEVINAEFEEINLADYGISELVMPSQPSLSKSDDPDYVEFQMNDQAYATAGYTGMPLVQTEVLGIMRAHRLGKVSVAPFEYDPVLNKVKVYTNIELRVQFDNADWLTTQQKQRDLYSPFYEVVYSKFFNYNDDYPVILDDLVNYPVTYVIIADRMFESQLQPVIEWKTLKGFTVITAYTDEIGFDNSAIRGYIQDLYNNNTPAPSFVLLVGDDQQIPAFPYSGHISDLDFCEFTGDHIPEIYYGRWSAQNPAQLQPQIDKTLEYEMLTMPDPSYLEGVTLVVGVDPSHAPTYGNGQVNYGTDYYFNAAHSVEANVWLYPASDDPSAGPAIRETINDGIGLVNYSAHCGHDGWSDPSFTSDDIRNLNNEHKYLLSIGNCCESNTFGDDYSTPCFGETWLQEEGKGGYGHIGGSNSTYWDEDYWWGVGAGPVLANPTYEQTGLGAYDGMFHEHGEPVTDHYITSDAIVFCGNLAVMEGGGDSDYYWEIYHLMGDPSIINYIGIPTENNIVHDPVVLLTAPSFAVSAEPGSYVSISMDGVIHGQGFVDASGQVEILLDAFSMPGTADIVITAQNKQPYIETIAVITPSGPYVVFNEYTIDDSEGNDNGEIEIGESISLDIELVNVGPDNANDITATLSTEDELITITDDNADFGDIAGDFGTASVAGAFAFDVPADVEDGHTVRFMISATDGDSTWVSYFTNTIYAPELGFVGLALDDSEGNGNGIIDPGETVEITVTIENTGSATAMSVAGVLSEEDDYVTISQANAGFGNIDPESTADNSSEVFIVTAGADYPVGHSALFTLDLTEGNGYETSMQFTLTNLESFEYGNGGYTGEGVWEWGVPSSGPGAAYDGEKVWCTVLDGEYPDDCDDGLVTPYYSIDVPGAFLSYYHWYNNEEDYDGVQLLITTDGSNWELITPNGGYPISEVLGLDDTPGFSGEATSWQEVYFDLSAYEGETVKIKFRFGSDGSQQRPGYYFDGVVFYGGTMRAPEASLSCPSMDIDVMQGDSHDVQMTLSNNGDAQLNYNVVVLTDLALSATDDTERSYTGQVFESKEGHIMDENGSIKVTGESPFNYDDVITSIGGPDGFGYTYIDSDEENGPHYEWKDITGIGSAITFNGGTNPNDDGYSNSISMGMNFEFYGVPVTDIQVSTNGWVSFNDYTILLSHQRRHPRYQ